MSYIKEIDLGEINYSFKTELSDEIIPILEKIDQKIEKHEKAAAPILAGEITAYKAFKNGCESAIASYIKLGQEGHVTQKIVDEGPIKSPSTLNAEMLIKALLTDFDSVKFVENQGQFFALCNGTIYQLETILSDVNFNQIKFSPQELEAYEQLLENKLRTRSDFSEEQLNDPDYSHLSYGEKSAINIYTGSSYIAMNSLLRGDIRRAINSYSVYLPLDERARVNLVIKELLLHISVTVSGLNKLPDFVPQTGPDEQPQKYVYRVESYMPQSVIDERKQAVKEGGKALWEMGFISTAHTKPASGFISSSSNSCVGIMIKNVKGKNVAGLSQFPSEREVLFPPIQMQWLYHKEIIMDVVEKQKMDLFIAKPTGREYKVITVEDPLARKAWIVKTQSVADSVFSSLV